MSFHLLVFLPPLLLLHTMCFSSPAEAAAEYSIAKPGCPQRCGNITVPYPFGTQAGCYLDGFHLRCDSSSDPPKLFLATTGIEATEVTLHNLTIAYTNITQECFTNLPGQTRVKLSSIDLGELPYTFSYTRNKFTAIGCDTFGLFAGDDGAATGCLSVCDNGTETLTKMGASSNGSCIGVGCCQVPVPKGAKVLYTALLSLLNHTTTRNISNCSHAFPVHQDWYRFDLSDILRFSMTAVPVVLDWAIGNQTCAAAAGSNRFLCTGDNVDCTESSNGPGYRCACKTGYGGNPFLPGGCQDIDECNDKLSNPCSYTCTNTIGSYICSCPKGTHGDGRNDGRGCIKINKLPLVAQVILGVGLSLVFLLVVGFIMYLMKQKKKLIQLKRRYFEQNGGLLLQQIHQGAENGARIFTEDELRAATANFNKIRILGRGGNGTVYKGFLPDERIVAIKKSNVVDQTQMEQFVNEVVILSQVIHRNVVRILGCCLETQVPLLVYEYIPNRTLFHHIHNEDGAMSLLSWETRLRIAAETAGAIAYLHSDVTRTIIHRDIKSANILLDHNFIAKVSDFGSSRLAPVDETEVATMVQGTLGYLDPEYFHSGQLTDKSDVYSFGVVLAELLTGEKPISFSRSQNVSNLSSYLLMSMEEDRLNLILDPRVREEGNKDQVMAVAGISKRCLGLKAKDRPRMKEVAAELERLRGYREKQYLNVSSRHVNGVTVDYGGAFGGENSVTTQDSLWSMDLPR